MVNTRSMILRATQAKSLAKTTFIENTPIYDFDSFAAKHYDTESGR